jgi:hypothetical protein
MESSQARFADSEVSLVGPQVGDSAPEFLIERPSGQISLSVLAAEAGIVVLVSQDSYRFHGT